MLPAEIIDRYRVRKGENFHLADIDTCDTCGLDIDKKDAKDLLEAGVNLRLIQEYLGHNSAQTTALYTHLTSKAQEMATQLIHRLMEGL